MYCTGTSLPQALVTVAQAEFWESAEKQILGLTKIMNYYSLICASTCQADFSALTILRSFLAP